MWLRDIAGTAGKSWRVPPDWARTVFRGVIPVLPHYLRTERATDWHHRFDMRLRGRPTAGAVLAIDDGQLSVESQVDGQSVD